MSSYLMETYNRLPVRFTRGKGAYLWDAAGHRYLDALSGIAVCGLGHAHPGVARAVARQMETLVHTSNLYGIPAQERLAESLCQRSGMDRAFFCNSGAEANEAAIKLARLYGHQRGIAEPRIIVMSNAFHGRTLATLSATGSRKAKSGFEPLLPGFVRVPYDDLEAVAHIAETTHDVVAVLVEPIQGEGGIQIPGIPDYLHGLRRICDAQGWLLMADEVQTGIARTGRWFAFQHAQVEPDVLTLAKGLGNGVPIGACLARGEAAQVFQPGSHGSTFGGNPMACAAAQAVLDAIAEQGLERHAGIVGTRLQEGLREALEHRRGVRSIRGLGLMIGIELENSCGELVRRALAHGLLINVTAGSVVRLLPPLIIDRAEAETIANGVSRLVKDCLPD
jgi:acetylornithine aminotransferase